MIINGRTKYIPKAPTKNVGNESLTPAPLWTKYIYINYCMRIMAKLEINFVFPTK